MGIYGTVLAPVGAVIVVDVYLARRVGITPQPATALRLRFNSAVLLAWVIPVGVGMALYLRAGIPSFFLPLPCWLACGALYIAFTRWLHPGRAAV